MTACLDVLPADPQQRRHPGDIDRCGGRLLPDKRRRVRAPFFPRQFRDLGNLDVETAIRAPLELELVRPLDGETETIDGTARLRGAPVMATDLRASVSLVIAGIAAEGETMVNRIYHLDRGFERLEEKLSACGASIQRISD